MKTSEIAQLIAGAKVRGTERDFAGLKASSTSVGPGDAFIALKGSRADGHSFIPVAIQAGANVIICSRDVAEAGADVTVVEVPDTKKALEQLLPALFPRALTPRMVGITGTNGKTTTTYIIESILKTAGMNPGVIGTINTRYNGMSTASSVTTPGPIDLFGRLHAMGLSGVDTCVMEVSSHSLDQERIMGLAFDCAVFTNLTQDHLDYHKDIETYFLAKKKLFGKPYLRGKPVINADDPYGRRLIAEYPEALTYGLKEKAMIGVSALKNTPDGLVMSLSTPLGELPMTTRLMGEINACNIMASVGASMVLGINKGAIISGIESLEQVPGRMELVRNPYRLNIIVDYAHTPDALQIALDSVRSMTRGRLITVFGCGGDRDRTKRPLMGSIAARLSDLVIVTSDNPRTEEPLTIIENILSGIGDRTYVVTEPDREQAIRIGIESMHEGDCLMIAGKGHENYQIIGTVRRSFDDIACVRACLKEIYGS